MLKWIIFVIASFFAGITIGLIITNQNISNNSPLIIGLGIISPILILIKFLLDLLKENAFEITEVFKTSELRTIWEKTGFSYKEKERHNEIGYYLRISKKRGIGKLEDCEGIITLESENEGKKESKSFPAVWRGQSYCRFRSIGLRDDLRLFNTCEDGKKILFFTHYEERNSKIPIEEYHLDKAESLNIKISVKFASSKGNVPNNPFTSTITKILNEAKDDY